MKELKFITDFKKLKSDLSTMTYGEKLAHLWAYYKWVLVVLLCVIVLSSILITSCRNRQIKVIMGGVGINVELSDEGKAYLKENYKAFVGSESAKERVSFSNMELRKETGAIDLDNYYALQSILSLISNHEVDYLITDREGFELMVTYDVCADLRAIYTQEELDALGDKVIYYQAEEGAPKIPVAVNIQDTAFIQENSNVEGMVYFIYVGNSERMEQTRGLYEYLLDWPAKK